MGTSLLYRPSTVLQCYGANCATGWRWYSVGPHPRIDELELEHEEHEVAEAPAGRVLGLGSGLGLGLGLGLGSGLGLGLGRTC
eukprot:scaffold115973_cov66-Phaeocystis_antarctica.AAC.1